MLPGKAKSAISNDDDNDDNDVLERDDHDDEDDEDDADDDDVSAEQQLKSFQMKKHR